MKASEAKQIALQKFEQSDFCIGLLQRIEEAAQDGNLTCNYYKGGEHFEDNELIYIRKVLGYKISWNGPCLWYEVSWE